MGLWQRLNPVKTCMDKTCDNKRKPSETKAVFVYWKFTLSLCLLTWWGRCSSVGNHTGQSRGWCRKLPASTLSAGWGQWPQQEAGTGPEQKAGSPEETAPVPLARPAECGPNQQENHQYTEWITLTGRVLLLGGMIHSTTLKGINRKVKRHHEHTKILQI